ncbi:MAG: sialidase family protein, partial [Acidimicrobiales bacterium]
MALGVSGALAMVLAVPAVGAQPVTASSVAPPPLAPPANVAVSDTQIHSYTQPQIAVDPANHNEIAVAYYDGSSFADCYFAISYNDGATWTSEALVGQGTPYPIPTGFDRAYSPVVAFGPNGRLYYVFQWISKGFSYGRSLIMVSTDGGHTFSAPSYIDPNQPGPTDPTYGGGEFQPQLAVDDSHGPGRGNVYIAVSRTNPANSASTLFSFTSTNHGATFSAPVAVSTTAQKPTSQLSLTVGPNSEIYVGYYLLNNFFAPLPFYVASSTNEGATFNAPMFVATIPDGCSAVTQMCGSNALFARQSIAAGPSPGEVYATWAGGPSGGQARVYFADSTDGGMTWSPGQVLGTPPGDSADSQYAPTIRATPNGRLDIDYYDLSPNKLENTFLVSSSTGASNFSSPRLLSDAPSSTAVKGIGGSVFATIGLASTNSATLAVWTDARRGNTTNGKTDAYFARVQLAPRGYRMVASDGGIFDFGNSAYHGSTGN